MQPIVFKDPTYSSLLENESSSTKQDQKTKYLSAQFFDALKSEDVPSSPLQRSTTLRMTSKEWSDMMSGKVLFVKKEGEFCLNGK